MRSNNKSWVLLLFLQLNLSVAVFAQHKYEFPYQDPELSVDERVADLISRMTVTEKASQLFNQSEAIDRLSIPSYNWWNECLHGVARAGKATVFPQAIGLAATFDEPLMYRLATAISDEARAKHHLFLRNNVRSIYTGLTFWTPNINIFRDPRWGRGQETYGEDPFLTGRMAVNLIKGLQGTDKKYLKTIATAKHYAVHSGPEFTRHTDDVFVNDRDLYETYLPAFRATVQDADVQSVMCAYNRFRDKPCCGSDLLLGNILRKEFGFKGYVVSDCGAITDFYKKQNHHVVETPSQAWGWSLSSGTDLNCEEGMTFMQDHLDSAVENGIINEKDINTSLSRLLAARFRLGMFDPEEQVPYSKIPMSVVGSEEHLKIAEEAAMKSMVLLKNTGILPLKNIKKVAVIGPNADNNAILIANYNGEPIRPITPLKAIREKFGASNVSYSPGCSIVPGMYTNYEIVGSENLFHVADDGKLREGLKGEYSMDLTLKKSPEIVRVDKTVYFYWERSPIHKVMEEEFAVRWTGMIVPQKSGTYVLKVDVGLGGTYELRIDDVLSESPQIRFEKGKHYKLVLKVVFTSYWWGNCIEPFTRLLWVETSRDYKKEALEAAQKAEVIIFCGGISANLEGEEMKLETDGFAHGDRTNIELPAVQRDLLKQLSATGKPIVYVNFSGSAVALNWENQFLPSVVQAFYPGEATGTALTRLLVGEDNFSGRLPVTFYKSVGDLPDFKDYKMEGRTYRYFKGSPLYEFGYGLSYTTFRYENLQSSGSISTDSNVNVSVEVTNTGKVSGEEVVQLYVTHVNSSVPVPLRTLAGFKRVFLKPGERAKVEFVLTSRLISILDNNFRRVVVPGKILISLGGKQPDPTSLRSGNVVQSEIEIKGDPFEVRN